MPWMQLQGSAKARYLCKGHEGSSFSMGLIIWVLVQWICNLQKCHGVTSNNCFDSCDLIGIWIQSSRGKSHRALCELPYSHISVYIFFPFERKRLGFGKVIQEPKGYLATVLSLQLQQRFHLLLLLSYVKTFLPFKVFGNSLQKNEAPNSSTKISPAMVGFQIQKFHFILGFWAIPSCLSLFCVYICMADYPERIFCLYYCIAVL